MNSVIVHLCGIILAARVVHARHNCKRQGALVRAPFNFSYPNSKDLELKVTVNLENLSPDVKYKIYKARIYESGEQQKNIKTESLKTNRITQLINWTKLEYQKEIEIKKKENKYLNMISIYLSLETKAGCRKTITILEAKASSTISTYNQVIPGYKRYEECLVCPCTIVLDLTNECIGSSTKISTTPTAGDTSTPSEKPSIIPGIVPDRNYYFNKNASTSISNVISTPHKYNKQTTTSSIMTGNDSKITEKQLQSSQDVLIYVISSVVVMCAVMMVIYISVQKYRHRNSDPVDTIEFNTYATANDVVYADLSLAHADSQPPKREEDSTYAQIIDVIRPVYENVKNK